MNDEILVLLARVRRRLNALIVLHRAFVWTMPGALASGLLIAALRTIGIESAGYALWALLCAASAVAGTIASRRSLLDERGAARWLDARLGEHELVSAAHTCARRHATGRFDTEVVARAALLAPKAAALRPPLQEVAKRGGMAAVAVALGAYVILLSAPIDFSAPERRSRVTGTNAEPMSEAAAAAIEEGGQAAVDFAASLFPDDKRMAKAAERALREGRIDDLHDLIKAAGLELDSELSRALSELERKKLTRERERLGQAAASISLVQSARRSGENFPRNEGVEGSDPSAGSGSSSRSERSPSGGDDRSGGGPELSERAPDGAPDGSSGSGQAGKGGDQPGRDPSADGPGGEAGQSGRDYGLGTGRTAARSSLEGGRSEGEAVIPESSDASFFELVLPGEKAATPIGSIVSSSRKSAESAMSRETLPLEYEDFVKSYFMALQQGEER